MKTPDITELVGIWQDSPQVAAGWSETYQFFDNGKYIFRYSQMNCTKRLLSYSGTWELKGKNELVLTMTSQTVLEGGTEMPSSGSCDFEIQGGEVKTIKMGDSQSVELSLSTTERDKMNGDLRKRGFGDRSFWKHEDDPTKY
jgi:hypothetical protein